MEFSEVVGIIVLLLALLLPLARRALEQRRERRDPEGYRRSKEEARKRQEQQLARLRQAMGYRALPPEEEFNQKVVEVETLVSRPATPMPTPALDSMPLEHRRKEPSRGRVLVDRLKNPADFVVLYEVLSKPVSLRDKEES